MPNIFGRPLWSFLPIGSWLYLVGYTTAPNNEFLAYSKFYAHILLYPAVVGVCAFVYLSAAINTHSLNPFEQYNIRQQKRIEKEIKEKQTSKEYHELYKKVFGPGGFADTNFDLNVDIEEKARAYKKLGLKDFPEGGLSLDQLEELVKKYSE